MVGRRRSPPVDYQLIDADGHYYEPDDCFSRHIEAGYRDATVRVARGDDGLGRVYLGDRRTFMSVMPGDFASAPGALQGLFAGEVADGFTHREVINAKDHPEFTDRTARRALHRWLEEGWGYGYDGRIFAVPMLSLLDLDRGMAELRRVLDAGARM